MNKTQLQVQVKFDIRERCYEQSTTNLRLMIAKRVLSIFLLDSKLNTHLTILGTLMSHRKILSQFFQLYFVFDSGSWMTNHI